MVLLIKEIGFIAKNVMKKKSLYPDVYKSNKTKSVLFSSKYRRQKTSKFIMLGQDYSETKNITIKENYKPKS